MGYALRTRRARATWAGVALVLPALWGCASGPFVAVDGGYRNPRHGYQIGVPPHGDPPWREIEVDGAVLAYGRAGPVRMTLSTRCGQPISRADILARHLRIGIPPHVVRQAGPVENGALAGWQQVFDATDGEVTVRLKTVTFVVDGCALDWLLSARDGRGFEAAEGDFDAWWRTLTVESSTEETP